MGRLVNAVEKHKLIRRIVLIWAMMINTYAIFMYFAHMNLITAAVTSGFITVVGLMNTILGMYNWQRHKEDLNNASKHVTEAPGDQG